MTKEEKYKEALIEIQILISGIIAQDFDNFDLELAKEQDDALVKIWNIVLSQEVLK